VLLRQLLGVVRKLNVACSASANGKTVHEFVRLDSSIRLPDLNWADFRTFDEYSATTLSFMDLEAVEARESMPLFGDMLNYAGSHSELLKNVQLTADILTAALGLFNPETQRFRHGPGAVSDQSFGAYKYDFKAWPERLEAAFPYAEFAVANYDHIGEHPIESLWRPDFLQDVPARLCAVPKTISKPRLIACEPTCLQWCQQSIRDFLYDRVRSTYISKFVHFGRQELNGDLALRASIDGSHATIDLSEASDRISCWHVERLFRQSPTLLRALQATRSVWLKQDICDYSPSYINLRKYSTMGNATTFPVQTIFFLVLAIASLLTARGVKPSIENIKHLGDGQVRVFGDDIIIHRDGSDVLLGLLTALQLKVNKLKTFTGETFRESCGVDAFMGVNVTTVNVLEVPVRANPGTIVSTVAVHHNLWEKGYFATASYLQKTVTERVSKEIRTVEHGTGIFGWSDLASSDPQTRFKRRWNEDLQISEVKCLHPKVVNTRLEPETNAGLLQFFTEVGEVPTAAVSSIGRAVRRPKTSLSLRWVPAA